MVNQKIRGKKTKETPKKKKKQRTGVQSTDNVLSSHRRTPPRFLWEEEGGSRLLACVCCSSQTHDRWGGTSSSSVSGRCVKTSSHVDEEGDLSRVSTNGGGARQEEKSALTGSCTGWAGCALQRLKNRKYNRKGQRLSPSNAILTHTHLWVYILVKKPSHPNRPLPHLSFFFNTYLRDVDITQTF